MVSSNKKKRRIDLDIYWPAKLGGNNNNDSKNIYTPLFNNTEANICFRMNIIQVNTQSQKATFFSVKKAEACVSGHGKPF